MSVRLLRRGPAGSARRTSARRSCRVSLATGVAFGLLLAPLPLASANASVAASFTLVQTVDLSQLNPPSPDPAGITYMPGPDRLLVSDIDVDELPIFQGVNLYQMTTTGSLTATGVTTPFSNEPAGMGFNPATGTLFLSDDNKDRVFIDLPGADGRHGTSDDQVTFFSTAAFGSGDPEGVEYETNSGHLFVADGAGREVYEVSPGTNGTFDGVPASGGDDVVTHFDLNQFGVVDGEGIGHDAFRDTLIIADRASKRIFEVTKSGQLVQIIDISTIPGIRNPSGVTLAPASDNSGQMNYWIVDRGRDNSADPNENDGKLYELFVPDVDPPPSVTITAPAQGATVMGTVTIDASAADHPGPLTQVEFFADGTSLGTDTTAPYSATWDTTTAAEGAHTITATATASSGQTASDSNSVTVDNLGGSTLDVPIAAGADDVEQRPDGRMRLANDDLELVTDGAEVQTVGLRFTGIDVPAGATILDAYVQFRADETSSVATNLTVGGEASDNALPFTNKKFNVSSRPDTTASVPWTPPAWNVVGEAGSAQRTPSLSAVVQEIVSRPGWGTGNALVLVITGSGKRVAEPFEAGFPPVLHIEYTTG
jgi:Bacterial Ig domain